MKVIALLTVLFLAAPAGAGNWPQWRGPLFNGSTPETHLPSQWSRTNNIAWIAPLPGFGAATPAVWEDTVFVTSPDADQNLLLICLDRNTGKERWRKIASTGNREKGMNNFASPSPVTDGKCVWVMFGTGDLAAYDFSGRGLWTRHLAQEYGRFAINWLYGASPMLYRDRLYVEVLQHNPVPGGYREAQDGKSARESYLLCLDSGTGTNLWRHIRASDAHSEAQEAYTTPIPCDSPDGPEILVVGANYTTAHALDTGAERWRCGGLNAKGQPYWRIVPTPVVADGIIVACGPKRDPVLGIKDGGKGVVTESHIAWQFKEYPSDCVTPLYYQKRLFVLDGDRQMMTCLDPRTGAKLWQGNLGLHEIFRASPTGADGRIYCIGEGGTVVVLAVDEFKILATIPMGEAPVRASITAAQGHLFIRTAKNLYCVGQTPPPASR